jgi:hypothetical protein
MNRILKASFVFALAVIAASCGGNSSLDNSESVLVLTIDVTNYNPDVDVCGELFDLTVTNMSINSNSKDPAGDLSSNQDVTLDRWVITPYRTDGGATASPEWVVDQGVFVAAGGSTSLNNWRVYPNEYLTEVPLAYLHPENGGFDPETGNQNIRQALELQIFGRTVSGKSVATQKIPIQFNFFCNGQ